MFFDHEKLDVYQLSLQFIRSVHVLLGDVTVGVVAKDHLKRASESIARNIVRANGRRRSVDRAKVFDVAYGSSLECAACLDVLQAWQAINEDRVLSGKATLDRIVAMLIRIRSVKSSKFHEERGEYGQKVSKDSIPLFAHEKLSVYQYALRFIRWNSTLVRSASVSSPDGRELDKHSTAVVLNIAEGNGKFSQADRKRFLQIAMSSGLQAASSLDILAARSMIHEKQAEEGKRHLHKTVSMIGALRRSLH